MQTRDHDLDVASRSGHHSLAAARRTALLPVIVGLALLVAAGLQAQDPWSQHPWPFGPPPDSEPPPGAPPPSFPTLPPLDEIPPNVNISAEVRDLEVDSMLDSASFGAVQAAGSTTVDSIFGTHESGGDASTIAFGGMSPGLEESGTSFGIHAVLSAGLVHYWFEVAPLDPEAFPDVVPTVPVLLFAHAGGSFSIGSDDAGGFIDASMSVNRLVLVGEYDRSVEDGVLGPETNTFPGVFDFSASPNTPHEVTLNLGAGFNHFAATGQSSVQAFVDPAIIVDPEATFEHEGETLRFVEHFGIAYSPGVEQWQPGVFRDGFESGAFGEWSATKP